MTTMSKLKFTISSIMSFCHWFTIIFKGLWILFAIILAIMKKKMLKEDMVNILDLDKAEHKVFFSTFSHCDQALIILQSSNVKLTSIEFNSRSRTSAS